MEVPSPYASLGQVGHCCILGKQPVDDARRLGGASVEDRAYPFAYELDLGDITPSDRCGWLAVPREELAQLGRRRKPFWLERISVYQADRQLDHSRPRLQTFHTGPFRRGIRLALR